MNRAFKIVFHNGDEDEKPIVTLSCTINNSKMFRALDEQSRCNLVTNIESFQASLEAFKQGIQTPIPQEL